MSSLLFLFSLTISSSKKNAEKRLSGSHYPNVKKGSLQFTKKGQPNSGMVTLTIDY